MTAETIPQPRRRHRRRGWAPTMTARKNHGPRADRMADYAHMRTVGLEIPEAAARVGISRRTAHRYETALDTAGSAPWRTGRVTAPAVTVTVPPAAVPGGPRKGCGTYLAVLLHLDLGEPLCWRCLRGEDIRRMERDAKRLLVSDEAAARNRQVLDDALGDYSRTVRGAA